MIKTHAFTSEGIEMGRVDERIAVRREVRPAKVVGQNNEDVGPGPRDGPDHRRQTKAKQAGKNPNDAKGRETRAKGTSKGEDEQGATLRTYAANHFLRLFKKPKTLKGADFGVECVYGL